MKKLEDGYELSSGRTFYANLGLVSIARKDDGEFIIREGYDSGIDGVETHGRERDPWSTEDRQELADFMIGQWTEFKKSLRVEEK